MSFDGLFTRAMINEINNELVGGRITKVYQPYDNEIILRIRANRQNHHLLISAHPQYARLQKTKHSFNNPSHPPHYCMVLRKYLENGFLKELKQVDNDRIIHLAVSGRNELGDEQHVTLVVEIMGRHSNIILINQQEQTIIDSIKHITPSQNSYRTILPNSPFIPAPQQDKINPYNADLEHVTLNVQCLKDAIQSIQRTFQGLSRLSAEALATQLFSTTDQKQRITIMQSFFSQFDTPPYQPTLHLSKPPVFTVFPYTSLNTKHRSFNTLSQLLDHYYEKKAERDRAHQQSHDLRLIIENELARNRTKLEKITHELAEADNARDFQVKGEILTAFMHEVSTGQDEITAPNFYHQNHMITIQLDPQKTPAQNAQAYFSQYHKLKKRQKHLTTQIKLTKQEITYLESVLAELQTAEMVDIADIRAELQSEGYLKKQRPKSSNQQRNSPASKPRHFRSVDGFDIYVGRNNRQNDELTHRTAHRTDWWLHAQNIPGSHVIIKHPSPSQQAFMDAAHLAAYYSQYRDATHVPVDAVQIKYVNKPNGAKPGFVTYEGQDTYFVTPCDDYVHQLALN